MRNYLHILFLFFFCFSLSHLSSQNESQPLPFEFQELQQTPPPSNIQVETEPDNFQAKFFNMLFFLALLIAFMLLASWAIKRIGKNRLNQLNSLSDIKIIETRYLSAKTTIYVLEIYGQNIVIAESHTGVTYLTSLPNDVSS